MSRVLALLALVAILAGGLWYVVSSGARRSGAATAAAAEVAPAPASRAAELAPPTVPATELASTYTPSDETTAEPSQREAAATTHAEELARARWVEGRVLFPAGTPIDEEVFVTADGRDFEDDSDQRVRVERDGTFRVAFSEKTRSGRFELEARYLYLPERASWKRGSTDPVVLEPALGGRIAVRCIAPSGTDPAQAGGKVLLHVEERDGSMSWNDQRGSQPLTPELGAAFDALKPARGYTLSYDGGTFFGSNRAAAVEAGETTSVEIVLRPGVVLAGHVRDEGGAPLAGVQVNGNATSWSGYGNDRHRFMETAADGAFRLGAFAPGDMTLEAHLAGFETLVLPLEKLEEGTTRSELELTLQRGGSISGVVRWPDGTPAEAQLELTPHYGLEGWEAGMREQSGKTDASGGFRITGLSAESYHLRARATKTTEVTVTSELSGRERKKKQRTQWAAELDRVKPGTDGVALTLSTGLALTGRVLDERGAPLSDFRVSATRSMETMMSSPLEGQVNKSFRDADGAFVLEGFAPGEWQVVASAAGHARSAPVRVTIPGQPVALEPVDLCAPREARVSGVVLDERGTPVADARVNIVRPGDEESFRFFDEENGERTDEKGAFELERLRPGINVLTATGAAGAPSEPLALELVAGEDSAGVVLRLRAGATLIGEVIGHGGSPQVGVTVRLYCHGADYNESTTTDEAGRFEATGLPAGSIYISAENLEGIALSYSATLREGETTRVRLAPPAGELVRLRGRVRAGGEPLENANVHVNRAREQEAEASGPQTVSASTRTSSEGAYELTVPGAGRYHLYLYSGNFASLNWSTTLEVPQVAEHVFDVEIPLGRVSGHVTDGAGGALAGIWIESEPLRHEGGASGSARTRSDDEGRYELVVPSGTHVVSAGGDGGWGPDESQVYVASRVKDVSVSDDGHVRGIDFVLRPGGSLTGSLRAPDGRPARSAQITSDRGEGFEDIGWCEDGSFHIRALEPGTHWIRAAQVDGGAAMREAVRVEIETGKTAHVELELVPATFVHVRVRDAAGAQVGCEIEVLDGEARRQRIWSGEAGEAWAGPLPAGRYTVRARREAKVAERVLELDASEPKLELELAFE